MFFSSQSRSDHKFYVFPSYHARIKCIACEILGCETLCGNSFMVYITFNKHDSTFLFSHESAAKLHQFSLEWFLPTKYLYRIIAETKQTRLVKSRVFFKLIQLERVTDVGRLVKYIEFTWTATEKETNWFPKACFFVGRATRLTMRF